MIKNVLVSLDEKIYQQLVDIKKIEGIPIVVSIRKAIITYLKVPRIWIEKK